MIDKAHCYAWLKRYACSVLNRYAIFDAGVLRIAAEYARVVKADITPRFVREVFDALKELEKSGYVQIFSTRCIETADNRIICNLPTNDPYNAHVVIPRAAVVC